MLKAKLRVSSGELRRFTSTVNSGLTSLMAKKLRAGESLLINSVQTYLRNALLTHPTIVSMLSGELRGPMGVRAEHIGQVIDEYIGHIRVVVSGRRNPTLRVILPTKSDILKSDSGHINTPNGDWGWLDFLIGENILTGSIADHVFRTQLDGKSLAAWSRTDTGIMVKRQGKNWTFPPGYTRDFIGDVLSSPDFEQFLRKCFISILR